MLIVIPDIRVLITDLGMDNQDGGDIDMVEGIPLQSVNSAILKKVRGKKNFQNH